ncbi:MAG: hypothetical protein ACQESR_19195 [Planctomycetota bacterium]
MPELATDSVNFSVHKDESIDLFLGMVSADVIVLTKLVRTLQPQSVLVLSMPHARDRGWERNARRMLAGVRGRLISYFCIGPLRGILTPAGEKAADLFESCISDAVSRIIEKERNLCEAMAYPRQGVTFRAGAQVVCELDTLLMYGMGEVLTFEAKTDFKNAEREKIEANIE